MQHKKLNKRNKFRSYLKNLENTYCEKKRDKWKVQNKMLNSKSNKSWSKNNFNRIQIN